MYVGATHEAFFAVTISSGAKEISIFIDQSKLLCNQRIYNFKYRSWWVFCLDWSNKHGLVFII